MPCGMHIHQFQCTISLETTNQDIVPQIIFLTNGIYCVKMVKEPNVSGEDLMRNFHYLAEFPLHIFDSVLKIHSLHHMRHLQPTDNHSHSHLEFHYNTAGQRTFILNFTDRVELLPGQWLLVGKDIYHEEIPDSDSAGFCLCFSLNHPAADSPLATWMNLCWQKGETNPLLPVLFDHISQEIHEQATGYVESCKHMLALLIIQLMRIDSHPQINHSEQQKHELSTAMIIDGFFNQVFHYEKEHLTIEDLAKKLYVSPRHVNRLLVEHYGMNFEQKLLATRMKFTEYLLCHTTRSVAEISELCDLSESYLIRSFRTAYGITPAKYRKLNRKDMI